MKWNFRILDQTNRQLKIGGEKKEKKKIAKIDFA